MAHQLGAILKQIQGGAGQAVKLCNLLEIWDRVVDARVGKNTEAIKIWNRTLYVTTSSAAWANELIYLRKEFIQKFNAAAGEGAISDICFRSK